MSAARASTVRRIYQAAGPDGKKQPTAPVANGYAVSLIGS
jgi:hypothetical protein